MLYIIILRWRWALCMIYPYLFHRWHCSLYVRPGSRCKGGGQVSPQAQVHSGWGLARLWGFRCCWCPRWLSLCVGWLGQLSPLLVRSNRTLEFTFWVNNDDRFDSFYGSHCLGRTNHLCFFTTPVFAPLWSGSADHKRVITETWLFGLNTFLSYYCNK